MGSRDDPGTSIRRKFLGVLAEMAAFFLAVLNLRYSNWKDAKDVLYYPSDVSRILTIGLIMQKFRSFR